MHNLASRNIGSGLACIAVLILVVCIVFIAAPNRAYAATLSVASVNQYKVHEITAHERLAYERAVAACMDYENQPNPIVVDMSDLNLTNVEATNAWIMLMSNGELFWFDPYRDEEINPNTGLKNCNKDSFTMWCYYDDYKITEMRRALDNKVNLILKRVGSNMSDATKVHILHDYVLDNIDYHQGNRIDKASYGGIVGGEADCFGYTLSLDVLLRRCGFEVDVAISDLIDHSWNLVKIDKQWYHVDTTWDHALNGQKNFGIFDFTKQSCHIYLLQSDQSIGSDVIDPVTKSYFEGHSGWVAHHACTSTKYDFTTDYNAFFYAHCNDYKTAKNTGIYSSKYSITGNDTAAFLAPSATARSVKVPDKVTIDGHSYRVTSIAANAFKRNETVRKISIGNNVATIGKNLFLGCKNLKTLVIGQGLRTIKASAFKGDEKLKEISIASKKLTKKGVKGSLKGSNITVVKVPKAKKKAYAKLFSKSNSGKKVTIATKK